MKKKISPKTSASQAPHPAESINSHLGARVKQLRSDKNWSLEMLASSSGVSRSMLSQIEREQANPTLAVTLRIAHAFGMDLGELVREPNASSSLRVIRADDRTFHYRSDKNCKIRTLSPLNLEKDVEFYEVQLKRGGSLRSQAHFEGTREFLTVEQGQVRVESGDDSDILEKGDSANYRADVPHAIVNSGRGGAILFLVVIYA
ncbi:MAG: helix-turn-helix domain-containing protein [Verrucomicrobia bacterium]|nr:helix-turn-helix domain-containing protein [Verrucomicrobiota bacterium]MDA1068613.1 helix-turn-helix domain-containing protein [Verrucomicrobiota bacterium]